MAYNEYDEMLSGNKPSEGNQYDSILNDNSGQKQVIQSNLNIAKDADPARKAQVLNLSQKMNLPQEFVDRNYDSLTEKTSGPQYNDYDKMVKETPALAKWLEKPENAQLGKNDIQAMGNIDKEVQRFKPYEADPVTIHKEYFNAAKGGINQLATSAELLFAAYGKRDIKSASDSIAEFSKRQNDLRDSAPSYVRDFEKVLSKEGGDVNTAWQDFLGTYDEYKKGNIIGALKKFSSIGNTVGETLDLAYESIVNNPRAVGYMTVESLANSFPSLIAGAAGGAAGASTPIPGAGLVGFMGGTFGGSVLVEIGSTIQEELQQRNIDMSDSTAVHAVLQDPQMMADIRSRAERKGITTAAVDALFSAFAGQIVGKAGKGLTKKAAATVADVAVQATGEATSEYAGQVAKEKGDIKKVSLADALAEGIISLGHAAGETFVGATREGALAAREKYSKQTHKAVEQVADDTAKSVKTLNDLLAIQNAQNEIEKLTSVKEVPDKISELVGYATGGDDGANMYFQKDDFDSYWNKKGKSPAKAAEDMIGDGGKSYHESEQTGDNISVPVNKFLASQVGQDTKDIIEIARTSVDGPTLSQAQDHLNSLPGVMEQLADEANTTEAGADVSVNEAEAKSIAGDVTKQLMDSGMKQGEARTYAKVYEATFNSLAERSGVTPRELFDKYGLSIKGEKQLEQLKLKPDQNVLNQAGDGGPVVSELGFHSKLEKQVLNKIQGTAAEVGQIEALLRDVKPEERKWSGIDEFLKGKKKVDTQELLEFLRANQLEIKEVVKGADDQNEDRGEFSIEEENDGTWLIKDWAGNEIARDFDNEDAAEMYLEESINRNGNERGATKFSQYTLPGGENYREVLLTMPPKLLKPGETINQRFVGWASDKYGDKFLDFDEQKLKEIERQFKHEMSLSADTNVYSSSHFDEKNILAHVRLNDRTDADGKRVLFVEEIQSDWHQAGRKKGYKGDVTGDPEAIRKQRVELLRQQTKLEREAVKKAVPNITLKDFKDKSTVDIVTGKSVRYENLTIPALESFKSGSIYKAKRPEYGGKYKWEAFFGNTGKLGPFDTQKEAEAALTEYIREQALYDKFDKKFLDPELVSQIEALDKQVDDLSNQITKVNTAVPDAPFKKTWHEFALKRVIRMAAEQGYDRVAWTTGEQQAERYDLSKQVDEVQAKKNDDGTYAIKVRKNESIVHDVASVKESDLEAQLGKDLAAKIIAQEGTPIESEKYKGKVFSYEGLDLKVGGEGMKGFYDNILVKSADKLGKKFGAKVGETTVDAGEREMSSSEVTRSAVQLDLTGISFDDFKIVSDDKDRTEYRYKDKYITVAKYNNGQTTYLNNSDNSRLQAQKFSSLEKFKEAAWGSLEDRTIKSKVHSLPITPELKEAATTQGFELFQENKGRIRFGADRQFNIDLLKNADFSTFLHESGHFFLEIMGDLAEADGANKQVKDDYKSLLDWFGVESRDKIEVKHHEQFARGFEAYLMEGKAPSKKLLKAFRQFKRWLISVYRQLSNLKVTLTPEVRDVMSRMMATESEIQDASETYNLEPMFTDPSAYGMTGKKAEKYLNAIEDAKMSAEEQMLAKVMDAKAKKETREYKARRKQVMSEVENDVDAQPIYQVLALLQRGKKPNGDELAEGVQAIKLDRQALVDQFGAEFVKNNLPKPFVYSREGGVNHNVVANMYGFNSGEEMVNLLSQMPSRRDAVDRITNQRMLEQYPDILSSDAQLEVSALESIHNDKRAQLLKLELEHLYENYLPLMKELQRRTIRRTPSDKYIKGQADKIIGGRSVGELRPYRFLAAEKKAAKESAKHFTSGDFDLAYNSKEKELLNHYLYIASLEAKDSIKKDLDSFKRVWKKDADLAKTRDMNFINAARAVLSEFGLGKKDRPAAEYLEELRKYDRDGYETIKALIDEAVNGSGPYKSVSFDDFNEMAEAVTSLWNMAKTSKEITIDGQKLEKYKAIDELSAGVQAISTKQNKVGYNKKATKWENFKAGLSGLSALLRRVEGWSDAMDVGDPHGAFKKYIFNPVSEATSEYRIQKKALLEKYLNIVNGIEKTITREAIPSPELGYEFAGKQELIGALLHVGNDSNKRKLLLGRKWGSINADGSVNSTKWDSFIKRMHDTGVLTKADWDFVQNIWDLFESIKPGAQKAHYEMYGHYFSEITSDPVSTPFGEYKGGYAPAIADSSLASDQMIREEREQLEKSNNSFMFPTAGRGFTKSRVDQYAAPLIMDLSLIPRHIDKVTRFTFIEPRVKDVGRLIFDKGFRETLDGFDNTVAPDMLVPWLQRAAQQQVEIPSQGKGWRALDRVFKTLRKNTGLNIMTANVLNTFQQISGLSIASLDVNHKNLRNSLLRYVKSPKKFAADVSAKSKFMSTRVTASVIEVQSHIDDLLLNPSKYEKLRDFAAKHGYFMQAGAQGIVDVIVWGGKYDQSIEEGMSEVDAVRAADRAVRSTQGSFNAEDVSAFEVGSPMFRAFTMFYSYFNMQANVLTTQFQNTVRDMGLKKGAGRMLYIYTFGFMIPAVLSEVIMKAGGGDWDEDDDDSYLDDAMSLFFNSQFRTITAFVPYVGQAANTAVNTWNSKPYDDRVSVSPAIQMIETSVRAPVSVYKSLAENGSKKKAVKDTLSLLGLLTGIPLLPLGKPIGYAIDVNEGKARPSGPVDFTRGLITGRPGDK